MSTSPFGAQLRRWRTARGLSQLDLAVRAGVSQRHLSFLETGRSHPRRDMVLRLGRVLEVAAREQNVLLAAAGHAPEYGETPLQDLGHITGVLDTILAAHQPHMALVVDRQWNVVRSNQAAGAFAATVFPQPPAWLVPPLNLMRLSLHPEGLRSHMLDWERPAAALLHRLERDVAAFPNDSGLARLWDEVCGYPGVAALLSAPTPSRWQRADTSAVLLPTTYLIQGRQIALFSTIMTIGDTHDLTLAELRLETFWPVDEQASAAWRALFA